MLIISYVVDACDAEEFSEKLESGCVLYSEEVVECVDEVFAFVVEDLVEYFFVVVAYDLGVWLGTQAEEQKPLSSR